MNIRVGIVTGQYPPQVGGVGHSAHRVANLLASRGLTVHVIALQKHSEPLPFDESTTTRQEGNVLVHRVKVYHPNASEAGVSESEILTRYNREMFHAMEHLQRQHRYEVLHAFFLYPAGYIAGLVGRMHGASVISSIRGNDVGKYAFDPLRMPFVRSSLDNADYVTSVATSLTQLADRTLTPIDHKAVTILNSIDPEKLQPRTRPDYELKGVVIGTAGLFRYKKGLLYLFKAMASLKGKFEFSLLLAGDFFKEEDREPHLKWLHEYGLMDRTIITGKIAPDRMADHLQLMDIMVFPSLFSEGCPLSMLEGMAMKKAVIGAAAGAIPEIVRHRENGLLVNPGSSEELAAAILELVEDSGLRQRLAESARQTALAMTPERETAQWLEVYQALSR